MTKVELLKLWRSNKKALTEKMLVELDAYSFANSAVRVDNFLLSLEEELNKAALDEHLAEDTPPTA